VNWHYTLSLDLFGSEISTNAANAFNAGIKGRFQETRIDDDHQLLNDTYNLMKMTDGKLVFEDVSALTALNQHLRDEYTKDCAKGVGRWNKIIQKAGIDFKIELPHQAFHRQIGEFANYNFTPAGEQISDAEWEKREGEWIPNTDDLGFITSLMEQEIRPGQYANWISPPRVGINGQAGDFEYIRIHDS
jgi:benzoyl-CoA 2,3-dioxygenase component B